MSTGKNGAGRYAGPPKKPDKKGKGKKGKSGPGSALLLAFVTLANILLSIVLYFLRRRDIVQAVESDEGVKLLLTREALSGEPKKEEKP